MMGSRMERQIYVMRVTLADVSPPVWRQIAVPGGFTLDRLHRIIQLTMGWQDCHLHSFEIAGTSYGVPDPDDMLDVRDELDVRVDAVAGKDVTFGYTYDFGDWWEHRVEVLDVIDAELDEVYPACLDGVGECPPEDVGGAYGYEMFRQVLADPSHADHEATVSWYGAGGPPFDPDRASALLRRMA